MPYKIKACAGKPYCPSNGTEGAMFYDRFCDHCKRDQKYRETLDGEDGCPIVAAALTHHIEEPEYPPEWTHDAEGVPTCTAFDGGGE